jgi:hypothetical protein
MFIQNKYYDWYYAIVNRAKSRTIDGYIERHHIVPKSLGGSDKKDNLVSLTAREHFVCHLLLTKMTESNDRKKMTYALWLIINMKNKSQEERYSVCSRTYETVRKNHSITVSEAYKGKKKNYSSFGGKKHKEETIIHLSQVKLGKNNPNYGVVQKPEWNKAKSDAQKGISKPSISCIHCKKIVGGLGNLSRWHNDCKHKEVA